MSNFTKDYYKILLITPSATADEVKLAYRKQVKKHHPDLHPENSEYEDLIKEINEAYEILGNYNERSAYDQFRLNKKALKKEEAKKQSSTNKRTYTKTKEIIKDELTYVKGKIFIKFFGKHDEQEAENVLRETSYKITVTQTEAIIESYFKHDLPEEFKTIFYENKPITLHIDQPVNCKFAYNNNEQADYKLEILNLTIPNPKIIDVTKHEGESFGTITGTFYGYVKKRVSYFEEVEVAECFGETGKTEEKYENGIKYNRKEYYNTNCSKYWGNWIAEVKRNANATYKAYKKPTYAVANSGCSGLFVSLIGIVISLLFCLFLLPRLVFLLPFILTPFLLNLIPVRIWNWIAKIAFALFALIYVLAIIALVTETRHKKSEQTVVKTKPTIPKPKYTPALDTLSNTQTIDTLISHHLVWDDYNGKTYTGDFSVKKSTFNEAHFYKENLDIIADGENNYDKIIFSLKENDKDKLGGLYDVFDKIKLENKPDSLAFAEIIVSFVQTIPYTLVLPKACNAQFYNDEFISKYLSSPDAKCDGYEKYGINTPVEFMAYLNGDCDTRSLLLYTILSHYNYDVALLSSTHYSHSIIGINLPYEGKAFEYNNQRYVFWETTVRNLKPGLLSNEISNTEYWRISLKSK